MIFFGGQKKTIFLIDIFQIDLNKRLLKIHSEDSSPAVGSIQYGKGLPQYTKSGQSTEATYHDQSGGFLDFRGSVILINLS